MSAASESAESSYGAFSPPPPRPARRLLRDGLGATIVAAFTERLPYKAAALFFSVVLWLVVSAGETAEQVVPVRLAANVDPSIGLVGPAPVARALVVGRARRRSSPATPCSAPRTPRRRSGRCGSVAGR